MSPQYDANLEHVIYGLDADLIMLALATHEPRMTVLRERVVFGREKAKELDSIADMEFQFLHVPVLREYLKRDLSLDEWKADFERLVDDWVFLCFFVGNDFLPHLPSLEIRDGAIELLMDLYKRMLVECPGAYLTKDGFVDLKNVEKLLKKLAPMEDFIFQKKVKRETEMEKRR